MWSTASARRRSSCANASPAPMSTRRRSARHGRRRASATPPRRSKRTRAPTTTPTRSATCPRPWRSAAGFRSSPATGRSWAPSGSPARRPRRPTTNARRPESTRSSTTSRSDDAKVRTRRGTTMALPQIDETTTEAEIEEIAAKAQDAATFLKAISHEGRLMILCHLVSGEKSVTELEQLLSARQAAVSQQLSRLRLEGLVVPRREGKAIYYSLADDRPRRIIELVYELFCKDTG